MLFDDGGLHTDDRLEEVLTAIDENNSDELKNMFSKTTRSQVDNFQEQSEPKWFRFALERGLGFKFLAVYPKTSKSNDFSKWIDKRSMIEYISTISD